MTTNIIILGGGFGGIYAALELEKSIGARDDINVTLVNQENFLLFTPMLHEIAASDLDPTDIVSPIHKLLKKVHFFCGSVDAIDLPEKKVRVSHGANNHSHDLPFDHLIIALGSVTHFQGLPGLAERALTMKSLGDAIGLRNQMIACMEESDFDCCKDIRHKLLTFVVAGGGFAGVETVAAMNDFLDGIVKFYPHLDPGNIKVILANSGDVVLPELGRELGIYAGKLLQSRGVEIRYKTRVSSYVDDLVTFSDGSTVEATTLVWTAGSAPNPLIATLSCAKEKNRLAVGADLKVINCQGVWALGDCAAIPDGKGGFHPPTAQHAIREAKTVARNILATLEGRPTRAFKFKTLGQLASLGHRTGVAQVFGFKFSGFFAWWMWRGIYLMKLPRIEKRVRVAINWTLDVLFSKDNVQLPVSRANVMRVPMSVQQSETEEPRTQSLQHSSEIRLH